MRRFSMLARHVISLVALAIALMTFGPLDDETDGRPVRIEACCG